MKLYIYFIIKIALCFVGVSTDCLWNINKDLPVKDPLFVRKIGRRYNLFYPNTTHIELKKKQVLIATCPGNKNFIKGTAKTNISVTCETGTKVKVDGKVKNINEVTCSKNVAADIFSTNISDRPKSSFLSVGYYTDLGWLQLYVILYDYGRNTPIYSEHVIHGKSLKGTYTGSANRPNFKTNALVSNIPWNAIFTKEHQKEVLTVIFGKTKAEKYLNVTFLSRGHLAPDADFHFHSWETATYFYANVVPQWQSINVGNWLRIENAVRNKAKELLEDLTIVTGSEGVLRLNGSEHPLYLYRNYKVPVPELLWKVVCTTSDKFCISFVTSNNPFDDYVRVVCENLCPRPNHNFKSTGRSWYLSSFDDISKGYTVCCDVRELMGVFSSVPRLAVNGVLPF